jgi:hypothetical protein
MKLALNSRKSWRSWLSLILAASLLSLTGQRHVWPVDSMKAVVLAGRT